MKVSTNTKFDVCAIGNALVDIIADADEVFLARHGIAKGGMTLIDAERAAFLYNQIGPAVETSGGSAGNTVAGIASLGGRPAYMGKVKDDQLGDIFRHDLKSIGVFFDTPLVPDTPENLPTGRCLIMVTPDAQRSMSTYLGVAVDFQKNDIDADVVMNSAVTYLEGYLFDRPPAQEAFREAARIAHEADRHLALTLSDSFCVDRHRAAFLDLVKNDVDILFANQNELLALYETNDIAIAIEQVRQHCGIAVTTRSEHGAIIVAGSEIFEVKAEPVAKVIDTTGAGDLYAAGFLYGLTRGKDLAECGRIGAIAAAEVISHYGPRPHIKLETLL